ncbi:hypothetical protein GHYDROH2_10500 [Geobacter hydrogenophilus]|uniref:Uncharacterized protein n=2 Tax=Geobacter hydrogenophilus TaxID=40983 RepID=A0A9W6FYS0_9BACT|nr:hypothetical protein GHYDROH2_10500 [Geobacter hydrogenophilus]
MELVPHASKWEIFDIVRCHIDSNVPLILGADIYNKKGTFMGGHAVTILGYQKEGEKLSLYVHDDRFGPFAKARVIENGGKSLPKSLRKQSDIKCLLTLQHKDSKGNWKPPHEYLNLSCLIIPTQKKVRISYNYPLRTCQLIVDEFENWLTELGEEAHTTFADTLTFSTRLYEVSEIKREILGLPLPRGKDCDRFKHDRASLLTQSCARFQWVGVFSFYGERAFSILFDATDIPQGNAITNIFIENQKYSALVLKLLKGYTVEEHCGSFIHLVYKYLNKDPQHDYNHHLDQTYGHLRAPQYLKPKEISNGDIKHNPYLQVYYERCEKSLDEIYGVVPKKQGLIWAIAADGGLLIGVDKGHPTLTGFKPARISGELKRTPPLWKINVKSGRYSRDYPDATRLLENALYKFKSIFPKSSDALHIEEPQPST